MHYRKKILNHFYKSFMNLTKKNMPITELENEKS